MADWGGIQVDPNFLPSFNDVAAKKYGPIRGGLGAGFHELVGLGGSAVQGAGTLLGLPALADAGKEFAAHQDEIAQRVGRPDLEVAPWQQGGAPILPWAEYQLAKLVPTLAGYTAATIAAPEAAVPAGLARLGAVLPEALEGAGLKAGASFAARRAALETGTNLGKFVVGGGAFGGITGFGQAVQSADQKPGGITADDAVQAAALSPAYAAAGLLTPGFLKGALKGAEGNILTRVASNALKGSAVGALQSGVMTGFDQTFRPDLTPQQKMANIVDATVAGAAVAGLAGGLTGVRALKHADPHEITTDTLDQATSIVEPQQPLLTSTVYADSTGRASQRAEDLTNGSNLLDYQTITNPKVGSLRWARAYEQGSPERPFGGAPTPELIEIAQTAANYLQNLPDDHKFTQRDAKVRNQLGLVMSELEARGHDPESLTVVASPTVEAVEPSAASKKAAGGTETAPVSTPTWETQRKDLLKGIGPRSDYRSASSIEDLTARAKARLEAGHATNSDLLMFERLGVKANEPGLPVEAEASRAEGQATAEAPVVDPDFQARWSELTKGARDQTVKRLKPVNEEDALRQVYQALAGPERREAGLGFSEVGERLEKIAKGIGLLDDDGALTEVGQRVSRETIPMQEAVKAALERGFKGAAASAFDRGAHWVSPETPKFDRFEDMAAFIAGRNWSMPRTLSRVETEKTVKDMRLGENFEGGRRIPPEQQAQRWLNQAVDAKYDPTIHPEENAQLKRLVAEGATARDLDDAERYLRSGRGALVNEPAPERPRDPTARDTIFGPTVRPEPSIRGGITDAREQFRQEQAVRQLNEPGNQQSARQAIIRDELTKSLKLALDNRDVNVGQYMGLRQALDRGDNVGVRQALSNIGQQQRPYTVNSRGDIIRLGRDRVAAADILLKMNESDGSGQTLVAHLSQLPGDLGNMARRFGKYVGSDVKIKVVTPDEMLAELERGGDIKPAPGTEVPGMYDPATRTIYLSTDAPHPSVFMHELVHSIVDQHIDAGTAIGRDIESIYNRFKKFNTNNDYAFRDPYEFMAEFLSRKQVRDYVRDFSQERKAGPLFARLWELVRKALGMPARDYIERLLNLAEQAGANPVGESLAARNNPVRLNVITSDKVKGAVDQAEKVVRADGLRGVVRKAALGWATIHDIGQHWGKWFGPPEDNPVINFEKHLNQKQSIVARMAQMLTTARDEVQYLVRTASDSGRALVRLMTMSEFGIDPTKPWDRQAVSIRDHPNRENLKKVHAEAYELYNKELVRKGHAGVYQNLRNVNDVLMFSQLAVSLHAQVVGDTWASKELTRFGTDPMDRFMSAQEQTDFTPTKAREWWAGELQGQLTAIDNYLARYRNAAAALDPEHIQEGRQRGEIEQRIDPLDTRVKNIRRTIGQIDAAPYFHLGRFGNYFVGWHVTDQAALGRVADLLADKGFGSVISRESDKINTYIRVENQRQQADLHQLIASLGPDTIEPGSLVSGERTNDVIRNSFADQWFERLVSDIEGNEDLDAKAKTAAVEALRDLHLDLMPENSISRVMTHREGVPGYDADMLRAFEHRANVGINALAGMVISPKVTRAFTDMRNMEKEAQHEPDLNKVSIAQRNGMTNVIDELSRRERERAQWPQTHLLDQMRAVNHAWFLGGSISYAFVNMTQLGATLLPELGARHGFVKSARVIGEVTPIATRIIREIAKEGFKVSASRAMDAVVTRSVLDRAGLKGDLAEFIMRVANTGQLDIGGPSRELMRAAEGRGDDKVDTVLRYASSLGYYSETMSRLIAALATRELNPKMSTEKAAEHASYILKETMWDYSQANQGREFGKMGVFGKVTPLATAFMQYTAQLTGKLYRETYEAIKGSTPAERAEARRFLAYHLTGMTVLAGSLGLPMVSALAATTDRLKDLFDDDNQPSDVRAAWRNLLADAFGKDLGEVLARGAPRAVGVDISQRVGEQDIIPFSRFIADRRNFKDSIKDLQSRSWGAPSSMVMNALQGGEAIADGDFLGGMARMLPNALAAPVKAYRMTERGYVDAAGHELPMTPGAKDVLVQLLGFNPAQNAEYSEARGDQQVRKGQLTRQATVLRNRLVQAVVDKDQASARDMLEQIRGFNRANPAFSITGQDIEGMLRRRANATAQAQATSAPLGVQPEDLQGQRLTAYANFQ